MKKRINKCVLHYKHVRFITKILFAFHLFLYHLDKNSKIYDAIFFTLFGHTPDNKYRFINYKLIKACDFGSDCMLYEIFEENVYDIKIKHKVSTIVDIGSNIGDSSLYFATIFPSSRIIGYEANTQLKRYLDENLSHNGLTDRIAVNFKAVVREKGPKIMPIYIQRDNSGISSLEPTELSNEYIKKKLTSTISLKEIVTQYSKIDLLKIDIEGYEKYLIPDLIKYSQHFKNLIIEFHFRDAQDDFKLLDTLAKKYVISIRGSGFFRDDYNSYLSNTSEDWQTIVIFGRLRQDIQ